MSKFKVGDKIVRTGQSSHSVVHRNIYTVRKVEGSYIYLEEIAGFWTIDSFILAEEQPFGKNLFGHKIHLDDELQSRLVQLEIFKAGGYWWDNSVVVRCTDFRYMEVSEDGRISTVSNNYSFYQQISLPELKLKTVTSLEIISVEDGSDKKELQKTIDELKSALDNAQQKLDNMK